MSKALVVLSGGQDSTTCLFWAKQKFDEVHTVTFDYGQQHRREIDAAWRVTRLAEVDNEVIRVPHCLVSTSPLLTGQGLEKYEDAEQMEKVIGDRIELTFVPMRNTLFFTLAFNRAVALRCFNIVTGICQEDNANYPDCTEQYRKAFERMANLSLGIDAVEDEQRFKIHAPLMDLSKAETVKLAHSLPGCWKALEYTHTSYDGKYPPTDMNHANVLRAKGFFDAGLPDPLVLRAVREGVMELPKTSNYA